MGSPLARWLSNRHWNKILPSKRISAVNSLKSTARKNEKPKSTLRRSSFHFGFLLLHQRGTLAKALAKISQLGATNRALAFDFNPIHARRVHRENTFHTFAVADAPHGEHLVQPAPALADHNARENLDAFLVAFDD